MSKTLLIGALALVIFFQAWFITPALAWYSTPAPDCPLATQDGRILVHLQGSTRKVIVSSGSEQAATLGPINVDIPAGTYDITLASFDDHPVKPDQQQPHEEWYLILNDASGAHVDKTNFVADIPDAVEEWVTQKVNDNFVIAQTISSVTAFHNVYPDPTNPNSVTPICAAFDRQNILPAVTTKPATGVQKTQAALNGFVDPNGTSDTTRWFEWGTGTSLGNKTAVESAPSASDFSFTISNLTPNTTYYFRVFAKNSAGAVKGIILTFKTNEEPAPTADIKANNSDGPITISYNSSASITWTSSNANSCAVAPNNWTGTIGSNSTGNLTSDRTYTVRCSGAGGSAADSVTVQVQQLPAPSVNLFANPEAIDPGQSSTLTWTSQNADTCSASEGWSGTKSVSGSETVRPSSLTTYRITCMNASGSATDIATVRVNQGSAPTVSLTANPGSVLRGNPSILSWTSSRANSCTATNNWSGSKSTSGNESVTPSQTTTYILTCSNQFGSSSDDATISVYEDNQFPTVTLTANPTQINQGSYSTLTWSSHNTTSCTAFNGWSGTKSVSGSESVTPNATTLYTITCMGPRGSVSATATVSVINLTTGAIITKNARNLTLNNANFITSIEAQSGDEIQFEIRARNPRSTTETIVVKDILPVELTYVPQSTLVNGFVGPDGITTTNGISISSVQPNEEKVITFRAKVVQNAPQTKITNYASISIASDTLQTASATIQIRSRGTVLGAATVVTGPENTLPWLLAIGFIGSLGLYVVLFRYRYAGMSSFGSALADIKLQIACWNIRRKERIGKTDSPSRPYDNDFI